MGNTLCGSDERPHKAAAGAKGDAAVANEDGDYELSQDHAEYAEQKKAQTAAKSKEIAAAWSSAQSGSEQEMAVSRYWFEFHTKASERLDEIRKFDKTDEEIPDQKEAHEKFLKELNFILEEPLIKIYRAYSEEQDNGDRKIDKEASLRLYDDFMNGQGKMALASFQEYATYVCKMSALADDGVKDKKKEAAENAEKAAIKAARKAALDDFNPKACDAAKLAAYEKVIEAAKAVEIDTEEATKVLGEAKEKQAEKEKKDEEKKAAKEKKDAEAEAKKLESFKDDAAKEKYEKEKKEVKEKEEAKKKAAEEALKKAVEEAGDDLAALEKAVDAGKKDKGKPDTAEHEEKLAGMKAEAADKERKDKARESAEERFVVQLNNNIDTLIKDWTSDYNANTLTKRKAGFEKFFGGKNGAGEAEFDFARDDLKKILTVGAGDFEGFVGDLGFKVTDSDALEAVKATLEKKDEEEKA